MEDGGGSGGSFGAFDRYADGLHAYACSLLGDPDAAADATVDALLVAVAAGDELADRARLRPWLYALVRNEALRRRPPEQRPALGTEAAELTVRHRLSPSDVASVLGHPAEDADRLATAVADAPAGLGPLGAGSGGWALRAERAAGDAARRAAVVRRARPFDLDGFPIPLDRPRLSGRALVWSAAAVVVVALGLLVALPGGGRAATGSGPAAPVAAGAPPAPQIRSEQRQATPTLTATRLAGPSDLPAVVRPATAPDRAADRRPARAAVPAEAAGRPGSSDGRRTQPAITLAVDWSSPDTDCADLWAATVTARAAGPLARDVTLVQASWSDGDRQRTVTLTAEDGRWTGELTGLPPEDAVQVTVRGATSDGTALGPASTELTPSC
ncbi:MAG TPA: sigma factor [Mycobacteriales bacterium]